MESKPLTARNAAIERLTVLRVLHIKSGLTPESISSVRRSILVIAARTSGLAVT